MNKPIILMTGGLTVAPNGTYRLDTYLNYAECLEEQGAIVLEVKDFDPETVAQLTELADGLLITGGVDMDPKYWGEAILPECGEIDPWRDALEEVYYKAFAAAGKPILGICRGEQVINVYAGGSLYQDIPSQLGLSHGSGTEHVVELTDAPLAEILRKPFGNSFVTNSFHHQSIRDVAEGFEVLATSEGGRIVEAIAHRSLPIVAVQWHPERMVDYDMQDKGRMTPGGPDMSPLFAYFMSLVKAQTK